MWLCLFGITYTSVVHFQIISHYSQYFVGLRKHKKIVGRDYSVFLAYEARNLNILGLNSRVEWEKLTSVCDYFHSPLFF